MSSSPLLYGGQDSVRHQHLKRQLFKNRVIPGLGILATGGFVFFVTTITRVWFLFFLTIPLLLLGVFALREAQRIHTEMKELAIYEDGIQLPLTNRATRGRSFLLFTDVSLIHLHQEPPAPYIDITLRERPMTRYPHYRLSKDFIFEWDRFTDVLRRRCTLKGVILEG